MEALGTREVEILSLISEGLTNREIAQRLILSPETIKWYNKQIYSKLGVSSRTQAVNKAQEYGLLGAEDTAEVEKAPSQNNLPAQVTSFVGRVQEIAEIKKLLDASRLVVLTGAGGSGKTRLALQVAGEMVKKFDDGVWLTELAPLANATLVPQAVGSVLGIRERPGRALIGSIIEYLSPRNTLLVLDNCEHVVEACAQLTDALLRACPDLSILATSRESLGISGEKVWIVPPLSLPAAQTWRDPTSSQVAPLDFESSEAIQLFVDRAAAVVPKFCLTPQNSRWVADICHRLDGMPLAIELAAARVKMLRVEQIAQCLDNVFQFLTEGSRVALPRHQTLRAAIDWSYNLLSDSEQILLQRLSVFAGEWTLEAAEAVCTDEGVDPGELLDTLTRLADKSMIGVDRSTGGDIRFRMLETIREYAWERLLQSGEAATLQRRHAEAFLEFARRAQRTESKLFWPEITTIDLLELDLDNFRAAIARCSLDSSMYEIGLRLASALAQFWQMRGYLSEAQQYFENLLSISDDVSIPARAEALSFAGYLSIYADDIERGAACLEDSLALYRELEDKSGIAWQLVLLEWVSVAQGEFSRVEALARQAFVMHKELGDNLGASVALVALGEAKYLQGEFVQAAAIFEESLALVREIGNLYTAGRRLTRLGQVAFAQGDLHRAAALIKEGLVMCADSGDKSGITMALAALVGIAIEHGDFKQAVRLLGSVEALREVYGTAMWYVDRIEYERHLEAMRAQLDEDDFDSAWEEGRKMTMVQAVAYAMSDLELGK